MIKINENVSIWWVEDDVWNVCEWFDGEMYEYYMVADEIESIFGNVWQC